MGDRIYPAQHTWDAGCDGFHEPGPCHETRGGENPGDWDIAESARKAAAAFRTLNAAFLAEESNAHSGDDTGP